jgi:steroid delta-isomerase-like uncharacterized protein
MNAEQMKAVVRRYYDEAWSHGQFAVLDELLAEDYENHDPTTPGSVVRGRQGFKQLLLGYREAFPDLTLRVDEQFCADNVVTTRWFASGTQHGALLGIPATGRQGGAAGITLSRFRGDRIVEDRAIWDALGLLRQLGAIA